MPLHHLFVFTYFLLPCFYVWHVDVVLRSDVGLALCSDRPDGGRIASDARGKRRGVAVSRPSVPFGKWRLWKYIDGHR